MEQERLARPRPAARWTRIDDYLVAMARLRWSRRRHAPGARTQPESPRLALSTLPFLAMIAVLGVLAVAIAIAAWPGRDRPQPRAETTQPGTAPANWFDHAREEMR